MTYIVSPQDALDNQPHKCIFPRVESSTDLYLKLKEAYEKRWGRPVPTSKTVPPVGTIWKCDCGKTWTVYERPARLDDSIFYTGRDWKRVRPRRKNFLKRLIGLN